MAAIETSLDNFDIETVFRGEQNLSLFCWSSHDSEIYTHTPPSFLRSFSFLFSLRFCVMCSPAREKKFPHPGGWVSVCDICRRRRHRPNGRLRLTTSGGERESDIARIETERDGGRFRSAEGNKGRAPFSNSPLSVPWAKEIRRIGTERINPHPHPHAHY